MFFLWLRSFLYGLVQVITVVPYGLFCVAIFPLPRKLRYRITVAWPRMIIVMGRLICGMRYQFVGWENLPDGPCVLLPKHQSAWETLLFAGYMPRELCFVYKRELNWLPLFGWALARLDMISIDRSKRAEAFEQVATQGARKMAEGRWMIMFPEGTRTAVGKKGQYKSGGTRLAKRMNVPVVPIALNAGECWPRNSFIKRPGLITVSIGKPISPDGQSPEALMAKVESWIEAEMRRISPHVYAQENT